MSDGSEASELNEKQIGMPPVFLLGGFLILATAGSAFFVMPAEQPTTTVSATLVIPSGENAAGQPYAIEESPAEARPSKATVHAAEQPDPETARRNRLIVGNWQQDYFGKRTLSVKADGTATMTILPSSLWQVAFGPKIDLTMFWSVKDGHLDYGINGGAPADKVKMAAKTWGRSLGRKNHRAGRTEARPALGRRLDAFHLGTRTCWASGRVQTRQIQRKVIRSSKSWRTLPRGGWRSSLRRAPRRVHVGLCSNWGLAKARPPATRQENRSLRFQLLRFETQTANSHLTKERVQKNFPVSG